MTKADLSKLMAEKFSLTKKDGAAVVDMFIDTITQTLVKGEKVQLSGFGNFEVKRREARQGRNPKTGEIIQIPAKKKIAFRAAKTLKEAVLK